MVSARARFGSPAGYTFLVLSLGAGPLLAPTRFPPGPLLDLLSIVISKSKKDVRFISWLRSGLNPQPRTLPYVITRVLITYKIVIRYHIIFACVHVPHVIPVGLNDSA